MPLFTNLISPQALEELDNCIVLDCRAKLGDPNWGHDTFLAGHIPGAQHADLDKDLAAAPSAQGRHPLPERETFLACAQRWGIGADSQVVTYDDAGGPYAARAWWMLRWLGHAAVAVLDGGIQNWQHTFQYELEKGPGRPRDPSNLTLRQPLTREIHTDTILQSLEGSTNSRYLLIDARSKARWAGKEEPIDPVAGHIPGAICHTFQTNLDDSGRFKSPQVLKQSFGSALAAAADTPDREVVCYCGSGVTAAHNVLAMHIAGLPEPLLYPESWSGWITDPSRPIATATDQ